MKKILFVVLDGLGDRPDPKLDGVTPLAYAPTPHLDSLAARGANGFMYTVGPGIAPESDIAVISILGYQADKYYTGRGPLESHALGIKVTPGTLAFRCNFATAGQYPEIRDRRVGRNLSSEEAKALAAEVNEKVKLESVPGATFEFMSSVGHRGVLAVRAADRPLSGWVSNTDPAYERHGLLGVVADDFENKVSECRPMEGHENDRAAVDAAALTNEFSVKANRVLDASPVNKKRVEEGRLPGNLIVARDAGDRLPELPPISETFGVQFGCFAEMPVEVGIAMLTGMKVVPMPVSAGDYEKEYTHWAGAVPANLAKYDGLYVHIKGPDIPGHDGKTREKADCIEAIDKYFFTKLLDEIDLAETVLVVTADHSTPCQLKAHSEDPVPVLIATEGLEADSVESYTESAVREGSLGEMIGTDLLPKLVELAKAQ
jgi:2,3-bisphosphoglycerate-independent phosphoglycerate mutase